LKKKIKTLFGDPEKVNVLVLGSGGREHCLVEALSKSRVTAGLHCAPGNPGIAGIASVHDIDIRYRRSVKNLCAALEIEFVVVGPEAPLADGVADELRANGIRVFGPGAEGARLESSKAFAKLFMRRHDIPTSPFDICASVEECRAALMTRTPPYVIKADGLASGKGVFLPDDIEEALSICDELMRGEKLGVAGKKIVIEDFSPGKELTVLAITDGSAYRLLEPSRDHKRAFDGDRGSNTGGMGAYAPVTLPPGVMDMARDRVLVPTLGGLKMEGIDFRGVLYMGLMLDEAGGSPSVSVVEYNVRFGDPETQAVVPLYGGDLGEAMLAAADGRLGECEAAHSSGCSLCVVMASGGYPGAFRRGFPISGLDKGLPGVHVYHGGTGYGHKRNAAGEKGKREILTAGGRVLSVVGTGDTFAEAKERAYAMTGAISFEGAHYRKDIGWSED
jgi:phosphoribosylamine--glycine ligase